MSDIPTDLFREILKRVPVESLFRCRSVCKTWRCIIDNPTFPKSQLNRGLSDDNWLIITNDTNRKVFLLPLTQMLVEKSCIECVQAPSTYFNTLSYSEEYFPVQCGLMLICLKCIKDVVNWCIWNPFTGESLEIPRCDETLEINCKRINGFGYDKAIDDYKIVNFVTPYTYVYSLRINSWRRIDYYPDCDLSMKIGVFFNGRFYWVGVNCSIEQDGNNVGCIITLDPSNGTHHKIPFPSGINEENKYELKLNVLGDYLFLGCYINCVHYVLWKFKGENAWIEVVSLEGDSYDHTLYPIAYLEREKQIVFRFSGNMFLWYNIKEISSKLILLHFPEDVSDQPDEDIEVCYSYQVSPAGPEDVSDQPDEDIEVCYSYQVSPAGPEDVSDQPDEDIEVCYSYQVSPDSPEDVSDQTDEDIEVCYSYQVSPASLVRLNRTGVNEGVSSGGMSGRKRKTASCRLELSTLHISDI